MITKGMTFDEYRQLDGWNWSLIKLLEHQSPRAVKHAKDSGDDGETTSRAKLRAIHCLVLEPHVFEREFFTFEGRRGTNAYKDLQREHEGKTGISVDELTVLLRTADAVRAHPAVRSLMETGDPEVTVTWVDEATDLPCKARLDWLSEFCFFDLKTLGTVHERRVATMTAQHMYHGQLAHYDAGLRAHRLEVPAFIVVAEGKGAQDVAVFAVDAGIPDGGLHVGRELRSRLMARLAECVETDLWPGRHEGVQGLCLPHYALLDEGGDITFGEEL